MSAAFGDALPTCDNGRITVEVSGELLDEVEGLLNDLTAQVPLLGSHLENPLQMATELFGSTLGLGINLHGLLPAVTSPRVRVTINDLEVASPMRGLATFFDADGRHGTATDVDRTAEARRRFKNVLLLPVLDCSGTIADLHGFVQNTIHNLQIPDNRLTPTALNRLQTLADRGLISADTLANTLFNLLTLTEKLLLGLVTITGALLRPITGSDLGPIIGELKKRSTAPSAPSTITTMLRNINPHSLGLDLTGDVVGTIESVTDLALADVGDPGTLVGPLQDTFGTLLGPLPDTGSGAGDCQVNANEIVGPVVNDAGWVALQELRDALAALPAPLGSRLGTIMDLLIADLQDLLDPAANGPTPQQIIQQANEAEEEVLVVVVGSTAVPLLDFFPVPGGELHQLLETHTHGDDLDVRGLVNDLGDFNNAATDARGIFRASLVE
ncbi:MAG TPA: hypothetical protein VM287_01945 [Egibacteraceae bacterium]|nr:hypothetical protein [Egibacteraceae bacterium]